MKLFAADGYCLAQVLSHRDEMDMLLWPVGHGGCMLCKGMAHSLDEGRRVTLDVCSWGPCRGMGCIVHSDGYE